MDPSDRPTASRHTPLASRRQLLGWLGAGAAATAWPGQVLAADWPTRPLRILAPFTPGAATDFVSRALAQTLAAQLGQPVVIENRPGASGTIAVEAATKAPADGYTLLFGEPGGVAVAPAVNRNLRFDALRDLTPVAQAVSMPMIVLAHPSLGVTDLPGLAARAQGGNLNYATNGTGSVQHLSMELLASRLGVRMVHVPYRGGSLAINDLIAGQVPLSLLTVPTAATYVKAGKVVALGVLDSKRSPLLPDVPTAQEQGIKDASVPIWGGLFAPAQTPEPVVARLSAEVRKALADPALRQRLEEAGNDVVYRDTGEFRALVRRDAEDWRTLVSSANIRLD